MSVPKANPAVPVRRDQGEIWVRPVHRGHRDQSVQEAIKVPAVRRALPDQKERQDRWGRPDPKALSDRRALPVWKDRKAQSGQKVVRVPQALWVLRETSDQQVP